MAIGFDYIDKVFPKNESLFIIVPTLAPHYLYSTC